MNFFSFLALLAICALTFVSSEVEVDDDGVLVLDDDNFDEAIKLNDALLVEFYAPWCGHCKQLAPEWAKAAKTLSKVAGAAKLAKVDATEAKSLASKFSISGFPTIKYFKSGKPLDYQGGRSADEIVNWVNKKSGPAAATLSTVEDLANAQEANEVFVVGIFDSTDSAGYKHFLDHAGIDDSLTYTVTTSAEVKSKLAFSGEGAVVLKTFDEGRADYTGTIATQAFVEFVAGATVPLVQEFSQAGSRKIFSSPIKIHSLFFTDKSKPHHETTLAVFKEVAESFKGRSLVVNVPSSENRVLEYFGLEDKDLPAFVLADMTGGSGLKKYAFTGTFDKASVSAHIDAFFAGTLSPSLKSEEPSPEDTAGPVVVVKGKTFNEIVIDNNKDVLVEFYAPWCGHCKKLAPIFDELGEKFKSNPNVVIAKMDSTANEIDVPGVEVQGFPTIIFFKGNKKDAPIKYEGKRELDDFVSYLEENAHHTVDHSEL